MHPVGQTNFYMRLKHKSKIKNIISINPLKTEIHLIQNTVPNSKRNTVRLRYKDPAVNAL